MADSTAPATPDSPDHPLLAIVGSNPCNHKQDNGHTHYAVLTVVYGVNKAVTLRMPEADYNALDNPTALLLMLAERINRGNGDNRLSMNVI